MTNTQAERLAIPILVALAAWWFLLSGAGMPPAAPGMPAMSGTPALWPLIGMWVAMMAAMMLPGVLPWIVARGASFAAGYLAVWTIFAAGAALVQRVLDQAGALSGAMALNRAAVAAFVVAGIGVYELTPFKQACLRHCLPANVARDAPARTPLRSALAAGLRQGVFCLGCCWALMGLLFVAGVMNVAAMLALTAFITLEKMVPARALVPRIAGVALLAGAAVAVLRLGA